MSGHIVNQITNHGMVNDNTLHVIGVVSNPARWHSRIRLFKKWRNEMLRTPGVRLYVVEGVFGDHHGECAPEPGQDYDYMQVKLDRSEVWLKESMINVGVREMFPPGWKYMCWSDTDVHFRNPQWAHGALRAMQTYHVIQPWSQGIALLADESARVPVDSSFGFLRATGQKMSWGRHKEKDGYHYAHSGYVWCCTRYFWENIEKLIDFCLIGSADHHMAWGCLNRWEDTVHGMMPQGYKDAVKAWSNKAHRACNGMVGYVPGILEHGHHGPLRGRNYGGRWQILIKIGLDPSRDIAYDGQGIVNYVGPNGRELAQGLISYNRTRQEDSIEST